MGTTKPAQLKENKVQVNHGIDLYLPELGVEGSAVITSIEPCPPIMRVGASGDPGRVVTGRFIHTRDGILRMRIAGVADEIGITDTHRVGSVDITLISRIGAFRLMSDTFPAPCVWDTCRRRPRRGLS